MRAEIIQYKMNGAREGIHPGEPLQVLAHSTPDRLSMAKVHSR
jgi:hypothetical protein